MFKLGPRGRRPLDQLRPGLIGMILDRLRTLNENTRLLVRLLEETDWHEIRARTLGQIRDRIIR